MKKTALILGLLAAACGQGLDTMDELDLGSSEAAVYSTIDSLVIWQHNITGSTVSNRATSMRRAFSYDLAPDILIFQECGKECAVGLDATIDEEGRASGVDASSIAGWLSQRGRLDEYRFQTNNSARTIMWRNNSGGAEDTRLKLIGRMFWGAKADPEPGDNFVNCPTCKNGVWGLPALALADARDDKPARHILVASTHWYVERDCAVESLRWFENHWRTAPEFVTAGGVAAGDYIDLKVVSGDWNATPDTWIHEAYQTGLIGAAGDKNVDRGEGKGLTFNGLGADGTRIRSRVDYLWTHNYNGSDITFSRFNVDEDTVYPTNPSSDHAALRIVATY